MVTVNLTLLVELVLFLIFLWGAHRIAFKPVVKILDEREEKIAADRQAGEDAAREADSLSKIHSDRIAEVRRAAGREMDGLRREAMQDRLARVQKRQQEADAAIDELRGRLAEEIAQQRSAYDAVMPDLVNRIKGQVVTGGNGP